VPRADSAISLILDVRKGNWNARWMEMDELLKSTDAMGVKAIGSAHPSPL
jgi:hypothetical protein